MAYTYPQLFSLERPPFTFALKYMPDTSLCNDGGNPGTGQTPPCTDCPDKMPFAPQDIFDIQWAEAITSAVIRLPNGTTVPSTGILNTNGNRLRISFCDAPPCFSVEINNECTFLAFERIDCYVDCATEPSPDNPNPIDPQPVSAEASFVQFEHVRVSDNVAFSTNIIGFTDAQYSYTRYPNTPVTFLASSLNGAGGAVADHLHQTTTGSLVSASITVGAASFIGWAFDIPTGTILGYTDSGTYEPAPLPPTFTVGNATNPNITFIVPKGTQLRARALFDFDNPPFPEMLYDVGIAYGINPAFGCVDNVIYELGGNTGLALLIPEGFALVSETTLNATSLNNMYLGAYYYTNPPLAGDDIWANLLQIDSTLTNILVRFKYTIINGNLYVKAEYIDNDTDTLVALRGYYYLAPISVNSAYYNQICGGSSPTFSNYTFNDLYYERVYANTFVPEVEGVGFITTVLDNILGNQTVQVEMRWKDNAINGSNAHYPPPNYSLIVDATANINSPTVSNTITALFNADNFGFNGNLLTAAVLTVNTTLAVKVRVKYKVENVHDLYASITILDGSDNILHNVPFTFLGTENGSRPFELDNTWFSLTLNNVGNTARFFDFTIVDTYLESI